MRARRLTDQRGQVLLVFALSLTMLLGLVAFAVDYGHILYARRALQNSTDLAASAGALEIGQDMDNARTPEAVALRFSSQAGALNARPGLTGVSAAAQVRCTNFMAQLTTGANCTSTTTPPNTMTVTQSVTIPLYFARVLGFSSKLISAQATATASAGYVPPMDIMIVLDATWSMSTNCSGGGTTKINCAKNGIQALLTSLWPCTPGETCAANVHVHDQVGLILFPPPVNTTARDRQRDCSDNLLGTDVAYDNPSNRLVNPNYDYVVAPISNDFKSSNGGTTLNAASNLVKAVTTTGTCGVETPPNPTDMAGFNRLSTSFATAIEKAQAALDAANGVGNRNKAQDVIIVVGDGGANYGPTYYTDSSTYRTQPCRTAITVANNFASTKGTWIYSIAYDSTGNCLGWKSNALSGAQTINRFGTVEGTSESQHYESPAITALETMTALASDPTKFFNQPGTGELTTIFKRIASDLMTTRLIDDDTN